VPITQLSAYNSISSNQKNVEKSANTSSTAIQGASQAEKQKYIDDNLEILDLKANIRNSVVDGEVPGVDFRIKNNGSQSLKKVEVTVYFKDKDGKIIYEDKFTPVSSAGSNNSILKPHYIWQIEKGHFYTAKSVPSEWDKKSVEAKVTAIEFANDKDLNPAMVADSPEATYVKNNMELYDIQAGMREAVIDGSVPGITFKIKNKGDKNLKNVTVTAFFKDNKGEVIYERKFYPVLENSMGGKKILKAGQIWQTEKGHFYTAKDAPNEWDGHSVDVEISNIQFE
jgi:DNA-binding protein YbaB